MKGLSIIIPTRNKPHMLRAVLLYYRQVGFEGKLIIADDSDGEAMEKNRALIASLQGLDVLHGCPGLRDMYKSILWCLEQVNSPYVIASGDDDFFLSNAMHACSAFLDANSDYAMATGRQVKIHCRYDSEMGVWNEIFSSEATSWELNDERPALRLARYSRRWRTWTYAVYRTEALRGIYRKLIDANTIVFCPLTEIACNSLSLIEGKAKVLDCFYHIWFSYHDKRSSHSVTEGLEGDHWFKQVFSDEFRRVSQWVVGELARQIADKEGVSESDARDAALLSWLGIYGTFFERRRAELWGKFGITDQPQWDAWNKGEIKIPPPNPQGKKAGFSTSNLRRLFHRKKRSIPSFNPRELNLQALLDPRHEYHKEFMSVWSILHETMK